ncbi:MAG: RluA family pseudouridine synthase [Thermoanaerobaculia bacterium]
MRLDQLVSVKFSLSRRKAREYVETGRVDLEGSPCREPGTAVTEAASVRLDLNRPALGKVRSNLRVLREEEDLLLVEKPAGLLSVPTEAKEKDTLLSRVNSYLQYRHGKRPFVGVVHRLDKDTSGVLVFTRTREALRELQELFRRHQVEREYVAIVEGRVELNSGTIGLDLVRDRGDRRRGTARRGEEGIPAVTHYQVIERRGGATLVSLRLETGRTHQIRVHLAALGYPVLGDAVYRPKAFPPARISASRQMLHARTLGFRHGGRPIRAESPIPEDFRKTWEKLASSRAQAVPARHRPSNTPDSTARDRGKERAAAIRKISSKEIRRKSDPR